MKIVDMSSSNAPINNTTDKYSNKIILNLKASIRPLFTYIMLIVFTLGVTNVIKIDAVNLSYVYNILFIITLFWFGERLIRNTGLSDFLVNISKKTKSRQ